ncbi:protein of unknown function [Streptomyces murinus]
MWTASAPGSPDPRLRTTRPPDYGDRAPTPHPDAEPGAGVSSHDRRTLRRMVLYPTCHAGLTAVRGRSPVSARWAPRIREATCTTARSRNS